MLTHIDLFSGIGGFALAAQWAGFKTVAFVEIDKYAQEIIKQNFGAVMADAEGIGGKQAANGREQGFSLSILDSASRIYSDIRTFDGTAYRGATLLTGGFPCQPFSQAGKRRGKEDDRYLWPEMLRVISEARPAWVIGENVAGIINMELDRCISDLEGEGYAVQALVIPACAVDAKHRRDRVWILGHANSQSKQQGSGSIRPDYRENLQTNGKQFRDGFDATSQDVADAENANGGWASRAQYTGGRYSEIRGCGEQDGRVQHWLPEPNVGRVANGIPRKVDRIKGLGNAIVPQVAYQIIKGIAEQETQYFEG